MLRDWIESVAARVSHYNRTRKYAYFMERLIWRSIIPTRSGSRRSA